MREPALLATGSGALLQINPPARPNFGNGWKAGIVHSNLLVSIGISRTPMGLLLFVILLCFGFHGMSLKSAAAFCAGTAALLTLLSLDP
jgi:hypothetical protein